MEFDWVNFDCGWDLIAYRFNICFSLSNEQINELANSTY